jgi:hypothetical protein
MGMMNRVIVTVTLLMAVVSWAQPAPMNEAGCCCVAAKVGFGCSVQSQAECMKLQPQAPVFKKMGDWREAWNKYIAADEAAEQQKLTGGWIAESCSDALNPKTGEPKGAPMGCCTFPPGVSSVLKTMTEFDCKAECSTLKEGTRPSGCTWAKGDCPH